MKKILSFLLALSLILSLSACASKSENLSKDIEKNNNNKNNAPAGEIYVTDFGARLLSECYSGENTLISPLSVMCALAMVQNGAEGETLSQLDGALGASRDDLRSYLSAYCKSLPEGEKYKTSVANSVWIKNDENLAVNEDFLQTNADYFSADIFRSDFNNKTKKDINNWVSESTDGMIPKIVDDISPSTVMYLINALAFEAEWQAIYEEFDVREGDFTLDSGKTSAVEFMYSEEGTYLEDENTTGFIKYYAGEEYAFAALLPDEDIKISDYVEDLTGEKIASLLENAEDCTVFTSIPKFETEYTKSLPEALKKMGIKDAFDPTEANLSSIGTYGNENLYISEVIHKTYIKVAEKGTRAGAATSVYLEATGALSPEDEPKEVYLDRPFVYMIIDCETNTPFFIGVLTNP